MSSRKRWAALTPLEKIRQAGRRRDPRRRAAPDELVDAILEAQRSDPPYSLSEIAAALGVSRQAVQQMIARRRAQ